MLRQTHHPPATAALPPPASARRSTAPPGARRPGAARPAQRSPAAHRAARPPRSWRSSRSHRIRQSRRRRHRPSSRRRPGRCAPSAGDGHRSPRRLSPRSCSSDTIMVSVRHYVKERLQALGSTRDGRAAAAENGKWPEPVGRSEAWGNASEGSAAVSRRSRPVRLGPYRTS